MQNESAAPAPAEEAIAVDESISTEDRELEEAYARLQEPDKEPDKEQEPEVSEAAKEPDDEATPESESLEIPTDLPGSYKAVWAKLSEDERAAILTDRRDQAAKYSNVNRQMQALKPIHEHLARAAEKIPALSRMSPDQVGEQIYNLAMIGQRLEQEPAAVIAEMAKLHGVDLGRAQGESDVIAGLNRTIQGLQSKLDEYASPEKLRDNFSAWSAEEQLSRSINEFSASKEHWGAVEQHLPAVIPVVQAKLGQEAAPEQVLAEAYEMAVKTFVPSAKAAQPEVSKELTPTPPDRTKAVLKAKSVNVTAKSDSKPKPMTEDEALEAAWARLQ